MHTQANHAHVLTALCLHKKKHADITAMTLCNNTINPIQARFFCSSCGQGGGALCAPFDNHVPLLLTPYCLVFLIACPKLDHMAHFCFHGNRFKGFKVAERYFFYKNVKPKAMYKWQ